MGSLQLTLFVISAFAVFKTGDSLRCWTCSSDMDAPCGDYFNTTRYRPYSNSGSFYQNLGSGGNGNQVNLQDCESGGGVYPQRNQRAVCMKKKQTTYGRTTYVRQCRFLHSDERVGTCPAETTSSATTIDFCEYCDYDGCNGAQSVHKSFYVVALLPLAGMLLMWK